MQGAGVKVGGRVFQWGGTGNYEVCEGWQLRQETSRWRGERGELGQAGWGMGFEWEVV